MVTGEEMLTAATESLYADSTNTLHNQLEDVAKYHVTGGMPRALFLFANQTKVGKGMILRKAGYIGGEYRRQYEKQNHVLYPVIELVLYWGTTRWKGCCNLRQLIDGGKGKIVETTWKYVDDMQLHVWEMRYLPKEIRERFHSDMRIVLDYLAEGNAYRSDRKVIHKEATIKMRELFDQYTRRGISRGIIIMCKDFNATYEDTLQKLKNKLNISEKEAEEQMKLYW